jgi:hypothetical protein
MEGKNEEGRNRGGLGIGASWVFGGREKKKWKKEKLRKSEWRKKKKKKKRKRKKEKNQSPQGSRTYRDRNKVVRDGVGEQGQRLELGLGGRKGKKSAKKKGKENGRNTRNGELQKTRGPKGGNVHREDHRGLFPAKRKLASIGT